MAYSHAWHCMPWQLRSSFISALLAQAVLLPKQRIYTCASLRKGLLASEAGKDNELGLAI